jgi:ketosteroid isomerase-like protein
MGAGPARAPYIVSRAASARMYRELTPGASRATLAATTREETMMTTKDLDAFFETGWNGHDVDLLMTFMSDDCVFESTAGSEVCGTRHVGRERVREAFSRVFAAFPDARFGAARHFVSGDRGLSEWVFTGTSGDGRKVEVNGCDVFTFRRGKIAVKSSFFKNRSTS